MDLNHRLPLCRRGTLRQTELLGQKLLEGGNGIEPSTSTFGESRSKSSELAAQNLGVPGRIRTGDDRFEGAVA
jgi:hypothetical protein